MHVQLWPVCSCFSVLINTLQPVIITDGASGKSIKYMTSAVLNSHKMYFGDGIQMAAKFL